MRSAIASPDTRRIDLANGQFVIIKKMLNVGERRRFNAKLYGVTDNNKLQPNVDQVNFAQVLFYLVDWSLVGIDLKPLTIAGKSIEDLEKIVDNLKPDVFDEIRQAVDAHILEMDTNSAAEKNAQDGANESSAISPSRVDVAGGTSGSVS